ncbi:MAG: hypothetical protein IPJ04_18425 [Candidatus Eisenbacteria bacterium]|nr:hypothetical protein [Candidatus Eisenbacteria bacterium]
MIFLNPAKAGALAWWMLPGLLLGTGAMLREAWRRPAWRLGLLLLVLYPVGDLVSVADGVNSLRSAAGLPALALVVGAGSALLLNAARDRVVVVRLAAIALMAAALVQGATFARDFFGRVLATARSRSSTRTRCWKPARR